MHVVSADTTLNMTLTFDISATMLESTTIYTCIWRFRWHHFEHDLEIEVIEWLLFSANSAIFQLYHGENKLIFIEIMTLYISSIMET
jgi:hypothetical protein